jgi:hypothetical protein
MMPGKGTDPFSAQITRNHQPGLLYYTGPQGATIGRANVSSSLPPIPEVPDSRMESPTYSQSSCDTSETHWSSGAWMDRRVDEDYLPLLVKDTKLQVYFMRMEKALSTFHPAAIHAEAMNLTGDMVANTTDVASSVRTTAETVARAGYRKVEYSRSCALIAQEIFYQLRSVSEHASEMFREFLIGAVMNVFDGYYLNVFACSPLSMFLVTDHQIG